MQLSTEKAVEIGLVLDRNEKSIDPSDYKEKSSFDLSIRDVLIKNTKTGKVESHSNRSVILEPQDSAYLISEEVIRIPKGHIAYVFLKNRQSQRGLLALNTGIIDQNYFGVISTLVTNLSSESVVIPDSSQGGKHFFRVVFHRIGDTNLDPAPTDFPTHCNEYTEYRDYRMLDLEKFPRTFLDVEAVEKKISSRITAELSAFSYVKLGATIAALGLAFTLFPLLRDTFFYWKFDINNYVEYQKNTNLEISELKKSNSELAKKINYLNRQVTDINSQNKELKNIKENAITSESKK